MPRLLHALALLALLAASPHVVTGEPTTLEPKDDLAVAGSVRLATGTWRVPDAGDDGALRITEDGTELDLGDAVLDGRERDDVAPEAYRGICIQVIGARNVTIRGGRLRGYRVAVQAMDAPGLRLLGVNADEGRRDRLASTPAREASEDWLWPHHDDDDEWAKRYGAGFSLTRCDLAHVEGCEARRGQNGLLLASSRRVRIVGNDFAWNSGWGVALWRASENIIAWNVLDHCVRGMSPGVYFRGQDSAAILLFEQCCSNVVYRNHATHSGDGLFLYAGHETTQRTGQGGSNHNVVVDNDFRFAVANGIEATFSTGNVFAGNDVSGSDHGVWAGYSRDTLIVEQRAVDCMTAGISIEHGVGNRIVGNEIEGGRHGVHLWWDDDKELLAGPYGQQQDTRSADNTIEGNTIRGSEIALRLVQDEGSTVRWNDLGASAVGLQLEGTTRPRELAFNRFVGTRRRRGEAPRALQAPDGFALDPRNTRHLRLADEDRPDVAALVANRAFPRPAVRRPAPPDVAQPRRMPEPVAAPMGRDAFRIGPYGPLQPSDAAVLPESLEGGRSATLFVFAPGPWEVCTTSGDVEVEPARGSGDGRVVVRAAASAPARPLPFTLEICMPGELFPVSGQLLPVVWDVAWYLLDADPLAEPESVGRAFAGEPVARQRVDALLFPWRAGSPPGVRADRFATRARTEVDLPAGRWRLRVTSDDGVRVRVDGREVLVNWTRHGPTEDKVELDLEAGRHAIEIEHMEIDGWAWLEAHLERVP
ncbi:MAG: right-handed parallel beta-helix repeat-containing protein [Planctomycetota bacterium]